jgi:hypothetical protein
MSYPILTVPSSVDSPAILGLTVVKNVEKELLVKTDVKSDQTKSIQSSTQSIRFSTI